MRLSPLQRRFLAEATLDADEALDVLARRFHAKSHTLRYAVEGLFRQGVIRVTPMLDRSALGLTDFHVFFSIAAQSASVSDKFVEALGRFPGVVFLAEIGGDFQYEMIISVRSAGEASSLLDELTEKHGIRIQGKEVAAGMEFRLYGKRYLLEENISPPGRDVKYADPHEMPAASVFDPDDTSRDILRLLSKGEPVSIRQLGQQLGLSHTAVRYRLNQMKEERLLHSLYYDVEPLNYGYQDYVLQLSGQQNRKALTQRLFSVADRIPFVSYAASYFGSWDYELGIEVAPAQKIVSVTQTLNQLLGPEFTPVRLLMRFRQLKLSPYPF